eukprot:scaffold14751_cov43-Cyclotella_meneghiniana.AAC.1
MVFYAKEGSDMIERVEVQHQSLGNTKISSNSIHNAKRDLTDRRKDQPKGKRIGIPEILHQILGYPDVEHSYNWISVDTGSFESRGRTKIKLDKRGNVSKQTETDDVTDAVTTVTESYSCREAKLPERSFTKTQKLLLQTSEAQCENQDKISMFGVRPVELMEIIASVKQYFEWFTFGVKAMNAQDITDGLNEDVTRCMWIDGIGRRVWLRKSARKDFRKHLDSLNYKNMKSHSVILRYALLEMIDRGSKELTDFFIYDDKGVDYPIAVFSKVTPEQNMKFIIHVLLVLGRFETELDIKSAGTLQQSFAYCGLIRKESLTNKSLMKEDLNKLMGRVIDEVLPYQPITEKRIDNFIVKGYSLLESVLYHSSIPLHDYPPCLATELEFEKEVEFRMRWESITRDQLRSIRSSMSHIAGLPPDDDVLAATKARPVKWDIKNAVKRCEHQSELSFTEQQFALALMVRTIDRYKECYHQSITKGVLNNGAPGAGNKSGNLYRLAQLVVDSLSYRRNLWQKHVLLSVDMIIFDEVGQLSSQEFSLLVLILRQIRQNDMPFGGVLIIGSFDHMQINSIDGLPFLLSSHLLTDYTIVKLEHSVRAAGDRKLMRLQQITRTSAIALRNDTADVTNPNLHGSIYKEWQQLFRVIIRVVPTFDFIDPNWVQIYHKKALAHTALQNWVDYMERRLKELRKPFHISNSHDMMKFVSTSKDPTVANDNKTVVSMLDRNNS